MDLDIEQYNYAIDPNLEYSIQTIAGICTQIIDTPVTRSSLLYENRSDLKLPKIGINFNFDTKRRRDINLYLEKLPNNGIPNKLRGIPILFSITLISHLSSYLLDKIVPNTLFINDNDNDNNINNRKRYYYSCSMHLYNKCKLQNMTIPNNQIVDANAINANANADANANVVYQHNWEHDKLLRKIVISSLCSLLTFPLYSIYVGIAFDFGKIRKEGIEFRYDLNGLCSNIFDIGKQMIINNGNNYNYKSISLYNGYFMHLVYNALYESLVHYCRELLIEISPKLHSISFVNRYLSKRNDPFEYSMFCIWWIPPVICRALCYPLIKQQNRYIINSKMKSLKNLFIKTMFDGVVGNTTRFMTQIQMAELFGLWSLIRFAHKSQYKQLIFEQEHNECTICYGDNGYADIVFVPCGHKFCKSDAYDVISRNMNCPTCRRSIQNSFTDLGSWKKLFLL